MIKLSDKQQVALEKTLKIITLPENYQLSQVREGLQDKKKVFIYRYTKKENAQLLGEHFSFTVRESDSLLLGVTWLDKQFKKGDQLPSKEKTKQIAFEYLTKIEPDLWGKLKNLWIEAHDETIIVDGKELIVTGMKYKCYIPSEDTYAWVIVGPESKVMTFERGIIWQGGRVSEKWLHDKWLKEGSF